MQARMLGPRAAARPCGASRPRTAVVLCAKAKGEKKGGKQPKKSALAELMAKKKDAAKSAQGADAGAATAGQPATEDQYASPEARMLCFYLMDSYHRLTKKYLLEGVNLERLPSALYRAPFALLAHNKFQAGVTDPNYIYANRAALNLFEVSWDEMLSTPSRKSAAADPEAQLDRNGLLEEAPIRPACPLSPPPIPLTSPHPSPFPPPCQDRNGLLEEAATKGVVTGFEAWRVSKSGKRFKIKDVTLFNIMDRSGTKMGQAAVFHSVETEDGKVHPIKGADQEEEEEAVQSAIPTPEQMQAAEAAVAEQAAAVRALKEEQGLGNADIQVQIAVMELKKRKERVAALQKALEDALAASKAAFDDDDEE
ncbi:hypothetical protein HYH03_018621 [Edaphochlamys debaryana]|uniref:MEKHLA domain-containing protein n=1 Tax=Edaphochlamys debaryana TaxID=47281 RepID=A0A835XG67_9CHLO|nr:hypothetical protein HYH03_018621 [Edaphochlamys debaryana]|eukprot:KAG2482452.1 hypothetical protein HYH03_018621 [Edaphochlamys debaryana]